MPTIFTLLFLLVSVITFGSITTDASPTPQQFGRQSYTGFRKIEGVGDTNIACYERGSFVVAPDGCNRCYCEMDGKLSSTCSRAICPPGFPSGGGGSNRNRYPSQQSFRRFNRQIVFSD